MGALLRVSLTTVKMLARAVISPEAQSPLPGSLGVGRT